MAKELTQEMLNKCLDAVDELYDNVIMNMENHFGEMKIPEGFYPDDDYLYYMAHQIFSAPKAKMGDVPAFKDSCRYIADAVKRFSMADLCVCELAHLDDRGPGTIEDDIIVDILDRWLHELGEIKTDLDMNSITTAMTFALKKDGPAN